MNHLPTSAATLVLTITTALIVSTAGFLDIRLLPVADSSLAPTLQPGDVAAVEKVTLNDLNPGDIIGYYRTATPATVEEGRIVSAHPARQSATVADARGSLTNIDGTAIVGRMSLRIPWAGRVLQFLQTVPGLIVGLYVPALIVVGSELKRLLAHYGSQVYRLPGYAR